MRLYENSGAVPQPLESTHVVQTLKPGTHHQVLLLHAPFLDPVNETHNIIICTQEYEYGHDRDRNRPKAVKRGM